MAFRLKTLCNWLINRLSSDHASNVLAQPKHPAKCHLRVSNKKNKICNFFHWILASYGRVGYTKMSFAQVAKGYLSTIANKNSFSLITNMRVASVSTVCVCLHMMICVCLHMMICVCLHMMICVCLHMCMFTYVYVYILICLHVYICLHLHTDLFTYMYVYCCVSGWGSDEATTDLLEWTPHSRLRI